MKQMEVQIMGTSYVLGVPVGHEESLLNAVHLVDTQMCKIRDTGKTRARERVAVLAALNIAKDLGEAKRQLDEKSSQVTHTTVADQMQSSSHSTSALGATASQAPALASADLEKLHNLVRRLDMAMEGDDRLL